MSQTTSGTFTASQSVITIINASLRAAQVIGAEETASGAQLANTLTAMKAMCKAWQASGIHIWCEEEGILFPQPGQTQYQIGAGSPDHVTLFDSLIQTSLTANAATSATTIHVASLTGILSSLNTLAAGYIIGIQMADGTNFWSTVSGAPSGLVVTLANALPSPALQGALVFAYAVPLYRPLRIMGGRRYNYASRIDIQISRWSRLDYANQSNKYVTGIPTAFFYDPQTGNGAYSTPTGIWNSWPTPQDNTNAFRFTAQRPIQDLGTLANIPDFPDEWDAAIKWNLALEIGPEHGCPAEQLAIIEKQAVRWYGMAKEWDRESESIYFGVARSAGQRR